MSATNITLRSAPEPCPRCEALRQRAEALAELLPLAERCAEALARTGALCDRALDDMADDDLSEMLADDRDECEALRHEVRDELYRVGVALRMLSAAARGEAA
jgi:hypothetical protein